MILFIVLHLENSFSFKRNSCNLREFNLVKVDALEKYDIKTCFTYFNNCNTKEIKRIKM